jgi:hypothetical protein
MSAVLRVESTLEHDGDGVVRFLFSGANDEFSASIGTWGQPDDHLSLASALRDLPTAPDTRVTYRFGTTGICELQVSCLDALGHLGVWATFTADWPADSSSKHQSASIFMRTDPASIDRFVSELLRFAPGSRNQACLSGLGP